MRVLLGSIVACLMIGSQTGYAEDCDVSKFKSNIKYDRDIVTNLAYVSKITAQEKKSNDEKADVNVAGYGGLTYGQANQFASSLEKILNINWNQSDREDLLLSNLDKNGKAQKSF